LLNKEQINYIFSAAKAIITDDHFVYAKKSDGWYHGSAYVNKDAIYPYTRFISPLCKDIADYFSGNDIEVVVGPTVGAVSLSQWVAHHYAPFAFQREVLAVYADEEDVFQEYTCEFKYFKFFLKHDFRPGIILTAVHGDAAIEEVSFKIKIGTQRILRRGYDKIVEGKRCLVVEDIINSGATVGKTIGAIINNAPILPPPPNIHAPINSNALMAILMMKGPTGFSPQPPASLHLLYPPQNIMMF